MTIALPGNLRDLVARAAGRPIYCTAPGGVRRKLMALAIETFRREVPEAEFVDVLTCYGNRDDHRRRWPRESARYGAVIVITSAENGTIPMRLSMRLRVNMRSTLASQAKSMSSHAEAGRSHGRQ